MVNFIIRLVGYGLLLGLASRLAQALWSQNGLDASGALQPLHDEGLAILLLAPIPLALAGFGRLAQLCVFLAGLLAGAAITAPVVMARAAGA